MTILDIKSMIDITRFRKINIGAQTAADVYQNIDLSAQSNLDFLKRCVRWIPTINFADYQTGKMYARLQRGDWIWRDQSGFERALEDREANVALLAVARNVHSSSGAEQERSDVMTEKIHTIGAWGEAAEGAHVA